MNFIKLGKYKHYKGNLYKIKGIARHSETLEGFIIYQTIYNSDEFGNKALSVRPKKHFEDPVVKNGKAMPRF